MGTKRLREEKVGAQDSSAHTDAQRPRKKLHTYSEDDTRLAQWFNDLADDVRATRISACREIVLFLDRATHEQADRILEKLIRGLCSNRKAARLGFSLTLTALLDGTYGQAAHADWERQIRGLLSTVESLTIPPGNPSNQERKDYQLGRCLAFRAVIQSKILHNRRASEGLAIFEHLLDHLFSLYKEAPAIRQECGSTANSILVTGSASPPDSAYATALLQAYQKHGAAKTPEGLAAWLEANLILPDPADLPDGVWHKRDPLDPKERATLIHILRDNSNESGDDHVIPKKGSTGYAQKSPCVAWDPLLKAVISRSLDNGSFFTQFWKEAVDEAFFSTKASSERKAIGLQLVRLGIARLPPALVSGALSPHVVRCIINQRSSPKNTLHAAAEVPLKAICSRAKTDSDSAFALLSTLTGELGLVNLDKLTRTKTLDELLSCVSNEDMDSVLELVETTIRKPKTLEHLDAEISQRSSADLLLSIARKQRPPIAPAADEQSGDARPSGSPSVFPWLKLFSILTRYAYLSNRNDQAVSDAVRQIFQTRTMSCLTHTMDAGLDPGLQHAAHVVQTIRKLAKSGEYELGLRADSTVSEILTRSSIRIHDLEKQLRKSSPTQQSILSAFKLLYALSVLQVHNGDGDAVSILEELHEIDSMASANNSTSTSLIEILLGFLSRPSALFRKLAEQVFSAIAVQVDTEGLHALLEILDKPENLNGQQELFENADDVAEELASMVENEATAHLSDSSGDGSSDEDDEDDEDDDDEDASDVEVVEAHGLQEATDSSNAEDDSDGSDASSESSNDGDAASEPDAELTAFESKLAQALKTNKLTPNGETTTSDTSDESDMDDDQMMELDGHLTKIFQERTKQSNKKKDNRDAKGTVVNFKNRVLDLLTIYVKQGYSQGLVLEIVLPLLQLTRTTSTQDLSARAFAVLKLLFDTCSKQKTWPEADTEELFTYLAGIHKEARSSITKVHGSAVSRSSLFIVKIAVAKDRKNYSKSADMYATLQKEWYSQPKSKIPNAMFTEWTSWGINSRK
ncbi:hypothetical protein CAC42_8104 [Sphaceloma murrayae]|uniref:DNA polymerase V n=1 Tax=Sphaceloma murrayae TaxID=2082308 RepID=A0A2K1QR99_9PEZI|nr:hypothetical protein CAC42_8104 [Sphaceloma murrayae]